MTHLHWTAGLHHDGSVLYVSNPLPTLGEKLTIRLRAPADAPIRAVFLRTAPDGEEHLSPMHLESIEGVCTWWTGELSVSMPQLSYRFRVMSSEGAFWLTAMGVSRADAPDSFDFKLIADFAAPDWVEDTVFYQIFPDRFYNGDPLNDVPNGAWNRGQFTTQQREWGELPLRYSESGSLDFYGGDLQGITQKLDYLVDLGVNAIFINPVFTAHTNHHYEVADYFHVDPHLGGDEALAELRRELDKRNMRLVLDVTPNHCGSQNRWFTDALADIHAPTADFFTFIQHPDSYASWLGHKSLVKLNYSSQKLRDVMYREPDSVMRHWLHEPYRIDGWRLDVANMTARQGAVQLAHKIWREMRRSVKADNPQAYFFGENFYDGTPHLQGDELDAIMNYKGFSAPLWRWLHTEPPSPEMLENRPSFDPLPLSAEALADQWTHYRAAVPWSVTRQQFNQLGSHDTPRILRVLGGDHELLKLGTALLMTFPGVPCIYYGDEISMDGGNDPDNRRCMRWDEDTWDHDLRAFHQQIIRLRRTSSALRQGGFQMVYAENSLLSYLRQSVDERLLIVGWRGPDTLSEASIPVRHTGLADETQLEDALSGEIFMVENGTLRVTNLERGRALILRG